MRYIIYNIVIYLFFFSKAFSQSTFQTVSNTFDTAKMYRFYTKIVGNPEITTSSYFIAFKIKTDDYHGFVIVEKYALLDFGYIDINIKCKYFMDTMLNILKNNSELDLSGIKLKDFPFNKVPDKSDVSQKQPKSIEQFIDLYFHRSSDGAYFLNENTQHDDYVSIIFQLFKWGIPVFRIDEPGIICIEKNPNDR